MNKHSLFSFENEDARKEALNKHGYVSENESNNDTSEYDTRSDVSDNNSSSDNFENQYGHLKPQFDISNRKINILLPSDEDSSEESVQNVKENIQPNTKTYETSSVYQYLPSTSKAVKRSYIENDSLVINKKKKRKKKKKKIKNDTSLKNDNEIIESRFQFNMADFPELPQNEKHSDACQIDTIGNKSGGCWATKKNQLHFDHMEKTWSTNIHAINSEKIYYALKKQVFLKTFFELMSEMKKLNQNIDVLDKEHLRKMFINNFQKIIQERKDDDLQLIKDTNASIEYKIKRKCLSEKEIKFFDNIMKEYLNNQRIHVNLMKTDDSSQEGKNLNQRDIPSTSSQTQYCVNKNERTYIRGLDDEYLTNKIDRLILNSVFIQTFGTQNTKFQQQYRKMSKIEQDNLRKVYLKNLSETIRKHFPSTTFINITPTDILESILPEDLKFTVEQTIFEMFSSQKHLNEVIIKNQKEVKLSLKNMIDQKTVTHVFCNNIGNDPQKKLKRFKNLTKTEQEKIKKRFLEILSNITRKNIKVESSVYANITEEELIEFLTTQNLNQQTKAVLELFSVNSNLPVQEVKTLITPEPIAEIRIQTSINGINENNLKNVFTTTFGENSSQFLKYFKSHGKLMQDELKKYFLNNLNRTIQKNVTQEELLQTLSKKNLNKFEKIVFELFSAEKTQKMKFLNAVSQSTVKSVFVRSFGKYQSEQQILKYFRNANVSEREEMKNVFLINLSNTIRGGNKLKKSEFPNITEEEFIEYLAATNKNTLNIALNEIFSLKIGEQPHIINSKNANKHKKNQTTLPNQYSLEHIKNNIDWPLLKRVFIQTFGNTGEVLQIFRNSQKTVQENLKELFLNNVSDVLKINCNLNSDCQVTVTSNDILQCLSREKDLNLIGVTIFEMFSTKNAINLFSSNQNIDLTNLIRTHSKEFDSSQNTLEKPPIKIRKTYINRAFLETFGPSWDVQIYQSASKKDQDTMKQNFLNNLKKIIKSKSSFVNSQFNIVITPNDILQSLSEEKLNFFGKTILEMFFPKKSEHIPIMKNSKNIINQSTLNNILVECFETQRMKFEKDFPNIDENASEYLLEMFISNLFETINQNYNLKSSKTINLKKEDIFENLSVENIHFYTNQISEMFTFEEKTDFDQNLMEISSTSPKLKNKLESHFKGNTKQAFEEKYFETNYYPQDEKNNFNQTLIDIPSTPSNLNRKIESNFNKNTKPEIEETNYIKSRVDNQIFNHTYIDKKEKLEHKKIILKIKSVTSLKRVFNETFGRQYENFLIKFQNASVPEQNILKQKFLMNLSNKIREANKVQKRDFPIHITDDDIEQMISLSDGYMVGKILREMFAPNTNKIDRPTLKRVFLTTFGKYKSQFLERFRQASINEKSELKNMYITNLSKSLNKYVTPNIILQSLLKDKWIIGKILTEMFSSDEKISNQNIIVNKDIPEEIQDQNLTDHEKLLNGREIFNQKPNIENKDKEIKLINGDSIISSLADFHQKHKNKIELLQKHGSGTSSLQNFNKNTWKSVFTKTFGKNKHKFLYRYYKALEVEKGKLRQMFLTNLSEKVIEINRIYKVQLNITDITSENILQNLVSSGAIRSIIGKIIFEMFSAETNDMDIIDHNLSISLENVHKIIDNNEIEQNKFLTINNSNIQDEFLNVPAIGKNASEIVGLQIQINKISQNKENENSEVLIVGNENKKVKTSEGQIYNLHPYQKEELDKKIGKMWPQFSKQPSKDFEVLTFEKQHLGSENWDLHQREEIVNEKVKTSKNTLYNLDLYPKEEICQKNGKMLSKSNVEQPSKNENEHCKSDIENFETSKYTLYNLDLNQKEEMKQKINEKRQQFNGEQPLENSEVLTVGNEHFRSENENYKTSKYNLDLDQIVERKQKIDKNMQQINVEQRGENSEVLTDGNVNFRSVNEKVETSRHKLYNLNPLQKEEVDQKIGKMWPQFNVEQHMENSGVLYEDNDFYIVGSKNKKIRASQFPFSKFGSYEKKFEENIKDMVDQWNDDELLENIDKFLSSENVPQKILEQNLLYTDRVLSEQFENKNNQIEMRKPQNQISKVKIPRNMINKVFVETFGKINEVPEIFRNADKAVQENMKQRYIKNLADAVREKNNISDIIEITSENILESLLGDKVSLNFVGQIIFEMFSTEWTQKLQILNSVSQSTLEKIFVKSFGKYQCEQKILEYS